MHTGEGKIFKRCRRRGRKSGDRAVHRQRTARLSTLELDPSLRVP
jgi:hypothetical protein